MRQKTIIQHVVTATLMCMTMYMTSCGDVAQPKPYAYFRIDVPEHEYVVADTLGEYTAEISRWCETNQTDDTWAGKEDEWINLYYPLFDAKIHLSYKKITRETFKVVSEESRTLAYKHTVRADAIVESFFADDNHHTYGILYEMKGNAASPSQFFVTDSVHHYLRGAIYFNTTPNADSIAPVATWIEQDVIHLIETLKWKNYDN